MELPNELITLIALTVGIATFIGVIWTYVRIRTTHPGRFDPNAATSKIEGGAVLATALGTSGLAFFGILVFFG